MIGYQVPICARSIADCFVPMNYLRIDVIRELHKHHRIAVFVVTDRREFLFQRVLLMEVQNARLV